MKSFVFLLGFIFFSTGAVATQDGHIGHSSSNFVFDDGLILEWMASCSGGPLQPGFSLYRHPDDFSLGYLYDYHDGQLVEHIVKIDYTNAGARAIVTSAELPTLILVATKRSVIQWDGKRLNCFSPNQF